MFVAVKNLAVYRFVVLRVVLVDMMREERPPVDAMLHHSHLVFDVKWSQYKSTDGQSVQCVFSFCFLSWYEESFVSD